MSARPPLPKVPEAERTPLVDQLLVLIEQLIQESIRQAEVIQHLRDEIAVLKGEKGKPKFKASGMERETEPGADAATKEGGPAVKQPPDKRPGSAKRSKTKALTIHETITIAPIQPIPPYSRFKGYRDHIVQNLTIQAHNIRYRTEVWQTPEGEWLHGELPANLHGGHFGADLRRYMLYQHHHCHVTQPLLHEQLTEWGIDLSKGQVDALLSDRNERFFEEKDQILSTALEVSRSITVDDSGARHRGKNGYVTQIGNATFAWFSSTFSKSRINFLQLLQAGQTTYFINEDALDYMSEQGLPLESLRRLEAHRMGEITDPKCWDAHLGALGVDAERHCRIATEGALLGGLIEKGFSLDLAIVSDGAGQFAILLHALCWVHAERLVHKLIPLNDAHRLAQDQVRDEIWGLYADLKAYQINPEPAHAPLLEARFDLIFTQRTAFETLNQTLKRLHAHKDELLLVLKRPDIPLHTNGSEGDIRGFVKWRKISGGTRSDLGRRCRDTFASLKITCRKLGISFWDYLNDRIEHACSIPPLHNILRERALAAAAMP
jgi:hypothetical protein